ncbi:unnamed protein product [Rhizoctonia solani]|uniref:BTB domain-containing protein n=1 Tax=Rhizoctonia solani TaxID=456999 RepID=A0A8H3H4M1_9AGAM|nr:unnamed protein product [Rhizoctonia solani]
MQPQIVRARNPTEPRPRPVSIAISSITHDSSLTNNQGDPNLSRRSTIIATDTRTSTVEVDSEFAYPDGNVELQVSTHIFRVHEFQLTKFAKIAELIRETRARGEITADPERRVKINIPCTGKLRSTDVRHTLRVIYSSFVSGRAPPTFDAATLVSTLRVATLYQNSDLKSFAISQLQSRFVMTPIHRIALSDELSIPGWEAPAFIELCRRPEPISQKEASVLGMTRTVEIARLREAEQRHQYLALIYQATTDPFLSSDGTVKKDKLQAAADQTLKHPSLPACDCRAESDNSRNDRNSIHYWFGITETNYNPRGSIYGSSMRNLPAPPPTSGSLAVIPCRIHQLAPSIIAESRTVHKYLSGTLGRLAALKQKVSTKTRGLPGSDKEFSVESEIKQAKWVRKAE